MSTARTITATLAGPARPGPTLALSMTARSSAEDTAEIRAQYGTSSAPALPR